MSNDIYLYDNSNVLKNLLNIIDEDELDLAERKDNKIRKV